MISKLANDLVVTPSEFTKQMEYLHQQGYQTISLSTLAQGQSLPKRPIIITFDDAYDSVLLDAKPILDQYQYTGTVFAVAEAIGRHNFWDDDKEIDRANCLSSNELMQLSDQGWEIGSHGATHDNLTQVDTDTLKTEIEGSRKMLEQTLKTNVDVFCYPYGAWNQAARAAVQAAGYQAACAISPGTESVTSDLFALRRVYVKGSDSLAAFKRKISSWYLWYRARRKR
jgi:peptidoglycan/xylan/chitin deacetylase (PgdA/CDA1 family)